jgi:putative PIG3 family NAD(P)H quinone oxidoreductase
MPVLIVPFESDKRKSLTPMSDALPEEINVIEITEPGGPGVLQLAKRPCPRPGPDEVLLKTRAAGVNRPDILQRKGVYPPPKGASDIPGLEIAGEIIALGKNVSQWQIGDKVCALLTGGGYGDHAIAHGGACLPVPEGFSYEEAAALPETFFTVWTNLFEDGALQKGERVLVHGATSGIGTTTIMLAKAFGAESFATAGTDEKCAFAKNLGAAKAFNYNNEDWSKEIEALGGVDVVLDMVGGDYLLKNIACLREGGRHISIAFQRGMIGEVNIVSIMRKRLKLTGSTLRARADNEKARIANALREQVWPRLGESLKPVIDRSFPIAEATKAHEYMESGALMGKIVLITP